MDINELTYLINGAIFEVNRVLGAGFLEKVYENALLIELKENGHRAIIFFIIQREDGQYFAPADHIDPVYGEKLREAHSKGVEVLAYRAKVTPEEIEIDCKMDFSLADKKTD